jgi:hypothetical protein
MACRPDDSSRPVVRPGSSHLLLMSHTTRPPHSAVGLGPAWARTHGRRALQWDADEINTSQLQTDTGVEDHLAGSSPHEGAGPGASKLATSTHGVWRWPGQKALLRRMRHHERMRAVGTHYGPTRIYGPTGHAIGGTAQQPLRSLPTAATAAGPRHYQ